MQARNKMAQLSVLALALTGALGAMSAHADDEEAAALKKPVNFVELGVLGVSADSAKFGEYSGLNREGGYFVGNFGVRGGSAYDANEEGGTLRWSVNGTGLGLSSRSLGASVSDQGRWTLGIGYDELRHNLSDTYRTPYVGSVGGNTFTLPPGFGVAANTNALTPAQRAAFHNLDVDSTRKNTSFNAGMAINRNWSVSFDVNHLEQSGGKLMGFASAGVGAPNNPTGQAVSILPMPTNYKTDTVNLALNWRGKEGHLSASYFGSFFRDGYDRVTFETFAGKNVLQTMSTAPSNTFHQLNLAGGYRLAPKTRLAGNFSYGRNTQDAAFVVDPAMMVTPAPSASLDGLVRTTHADLKLTDQSIKNLTLAAGFKYDERDNQTASNLYNFHAVSGNAAHIANYANTPLSTRKSQFELSGDYRLSKDQRLRLAYGHETLSRWCNQYAIANANCVVATGSREDKLDATYKLKWNQDVDFKLGYVYSKRRTDSDPTAIAAFITTKIVGAPVGTNAGDFLGFYPYFNASRTQHQVKAGVNWQMADRLALGFSGRHTRDQYDDSTYGVQDGSSWSANLDLTYSYAENGSVFAYLTQQQRQRDMTSMQNVTTVWSNTLTDDDSSVGLGFNQTGLMSGKFDLSGDLTYLLGKARYSTLNPSVATCATAGTCGAPPDIRSEMYQFKLTGSYRLDKKSQLTLQYLYQRLRSNDYYYNGLQEGFTPNALMPTFQQSGDYNINAVAVTYLYRF